MLVLKHLPARGCVKPVPRGRDQRNICHALWPRNDDDFRHASNSSFRWIRKFPEKLPLLVVADVKENPSVVPEHSPLFKVCHVQLSGVETFLRLFVENFVPVLLNDDSFLNRGGGRDDV